MTLLRAFSSLGCAEFSLEEVLALAARRGFGAVELRALGGTVELPGYLAAKFGSPRALAEKLRGSAVRIVALGSSLRLADHIPEDRERLLEYLPWAEALGIKWVRVFDGGKTADAAELARAADTLRWWRTERAVCGWTADLMVETHDSLFTAAAIRRFTEAVPQVAILWDSHHTWKRGGEDPLVTWQAVRDCIVHVHVKDSVSVPSAKHPFSYVLPGAGEFPMAPLVAALRADRFTGPVSLEWERLWHPYLASLEEALAAAAANSWW